MGQTVSADSTNSRRRYSWPAREKACCPFFGFTFEVGVDGITMRIEVADDAVPALDTLAGPRYPANTGPGTVVTS